MRPLIISLCLLALALSACGGNDSGKGIPDSTASSLLAELGAVQRRLDQGSVGACEDVLNQSVPAIQRGLDSLPDDTDPDLKSALDDSFTKLRTLSEQECDKRRQEAEDKKPETQPTPEPTTTETTPPPTTTETTPPTTTETTPKPKPKDEGKKEEKKAPDKGKNETGGAKQGILPEAGQGGGVSSGDG